MTDRSEELSAEEPRTDTGKWLLAHQGLINIGRVDGGMRGDEIDNAILAIADGRHHDPEHGPYRGLDNDPILASMMREEAAELATEYRRLITDQPASTEVGEDG